MGNPTVDEIEEIARKLQEAPTHNQAASRVMPGVTFTGPVTVHYGGHTTWLIWPISLLSLMLATAAFIFFILGLASDAAAAPLGPQAGRKPTVPPVAPGHIHASQRNPRLFAANFYKSLIKRARSIKSRLIPTNPAYRTPTVAAQ